MSIQVINENDYIRDSRAVINSNFTELDEGKAPLSSPAFTGTPTAPTPTATDDSTKVATTEFVHDNTDNKLPLAGGTMTGQIKLSGGGADKRVCNVDTSSTTSFCGGTAYNNGAIIWLMGKDNTGSPGHFQIDAHDGNTYKRLEGAADGTLTWGGNDIAIAKDVAPIYGKHGNAPSLTVPSDAIYLMVVCNYSYNVPSTSKVYIGLLGGGDYNDGVQHIGTVDILRGSDYASLGLTYSITTDGTKKITVSASTNTTNISLIKVFA